MSKKKRLKPMSKEMIKDATDVIINIEDDDEAIACLKNMLEDDYPELDLGRMSLHEAVDVLNGNEADKRSKGMAAIEDLNESLGKFLIKQQANAEALTKRTKKNKRNKKRKARRPRKAKRK